MISTVTCWIFKSSHRITKSGDVIIVPTPGHTSGHQSVILRDKDYDYFFAGDTSYTENLMVRKVIDGVTSNMEEALSTMANIHEYIEKNPTIYLPSHDPASKNRLEDAKLTNLAVSS